MSTQVATIPATAERRSVLLSMSSKYNMEPAAFEATLRGTVFPANGTREQFAAFLLVANEYGLNPVTKEIYAFPAKGGGVVPIVSIDGWLNIINSHPQLNGIEFDDHANNGKVTAITCRIWRKDREKPIVVSEYLEECVRQTEPWQKWPRRMLRHKALIQCARYAFGFAGIVDPDEAERMDADTSPIRTINQDDGPPAPPAAPTPAVGRDPDPELAEFGRDDGQQVEWKDDDPPARDPLDIPPELDRRPKKPPVIETTATDVFDPAQWLRDLEGALSGCEDFASLGEVQAQMITPHKRTAFPPDMTKAMKLFNDHVVRLQGIMSAG
jgi:phage recombination protein Bet